MTFLKDTHVLIPETCKCCHMWEEREKTTFVGMIKYFKRGNYPGLS